MYQRISFLKDPGETVVKASKLLKSGGVIVYPTETLYGLGAAIDQPKALERVFKIKNRNRNKPVIVAVGSLEQATELVGNSKYLKPLFDRFMPGPLTLVLKSKGGINPLLASEDDNIAIRVPAHPFTRELSKVLKIPFTTTSANVAGDKAPHNLSEVSDKFLSQLSDDDLVVDGGDLGKGSASTILDLTQDPPKILREGPTSRSEIEEATNF